MGVTAMKDCDNGKKFDQKMIHKLDRGLGALLH
jgi:hypothetical protein